MKKDIIVGNIVSGAIATSGFAQVKTEFGIKCGICDEVKTFDYKLGYPTGFLLCDQCKKDLKEFVLSKRK
jgi:hypothetical protein